MIRCIRKLFTLAVVLVLLAAFGYSVVLPRVLPLQYRDIVEQYAAEYGLEEAFVYGVIFCESHFEPDVISSADAVGLMQVTEETGKWAAAQMGLDPTTIDLDRSGYEYPYRLLVFKLADRKIRRCFGNRSGRL